MTIAIICVQLSLSVIATWLTLNVIRLRRHMDTLEHPPERPRTAHDFLPGLPDEDGTPPTVSKFVPVMKIDDDGSIHIKGTHHIDPETPLREGWHNE